uniref:C2H2-type domain-containing protein n=1 Tax=Lygus hesperus TaxID=30085 RepID=A0A146LPA7_LYGHE
MAGDIKVSIGSNTDDPYECTECSKKFSYKKTLARHVRNKHSIFGKPCICEYCKSRFNDKWAMSKHIASTHMKKHHVLICPICHYKDSKIMIDIHFEKVHNISLEEEHFTFSTLEEFEKWKMKIEKSTVARFVVNQKFKKKNGAERIIFNCHRSGFFKPRGKNKRKIKSQGTNKIMGFCPARLEFEALDKGGIMVQFIKTHVGHENEEEKVFSQYEMRCLKRPAQVVQTEVKHEEKELIRLDSTRIPVHLISNYCQIVDAESIAGIGEIKPIMVGEFTFSNNNNLISFIRTQDVRDGDLIEIEGLDNSGEETATLHSATVINVNSITTVDLNGDISGLDMSTVLSNGLEKEVQDGGLDGLQDLEMPEANMQESYALDLNKFLTERLEEQDKITEDDSANQERTEDMDPIGYNAEDGVIGFNPLGPSKPEPDAEPVSSVIDVSPEVFHLSQDKQLLIDRFKTLIEAVESRDLLWEMKKICLPAMETMKSLLVQNLIEAIPFKDEK